MYLRAAAVAAAVLLPAQGVLACGGMVSESGGAELTGFEALLRWDGSTEELLVSVAFEAADPEFGWLMPLPSAPEVEEGDPAPIEAAFEITQPPQAPPEDDGEGAGAPVVGGEPGVDVIGRDTVGGLRFVTLGGERAAEVARWMRKHGFAFHDRQAPVMQGYLDRGWVIVAARVAPGEEPASSLTPVLFSFAADRPTYPLAMAGAGHRNQDLDMTLFVLSPFRPASTTYPETLVRPDPETGFPSPGRRLELRYSAPLRGNAPRLDASAGTWLTRYEASFDVPALTDDLVLVRAEEQAPLDYSDLADESVAWLSWVLIPLALVLLAIWISMRMARRRRVAEAARMPGSGIGS